ncbi:cytochrome P450 [Xylariales sp. AK1849]|nr:cytochrome P450 [Xylariales sp. AK1849]
MGQLYTYDLVVSTLLLIVVGALYRLIIYPVILSPLSKVPRAHWSSSISRIWILWARYQSRENTTLAEAHRKYGPVIRLSPDEVSINCMEAVKTVYQGGFDKHQWYSVFDNYGVPNTFSSSSAKHHSLRKRMVSHAYSKTSIHSSASLAAQAQIIINDRLLPTLQASAPEDQQPHGIDVHSLFCAVAMDSISMYCFGARSGSNFIEQKTYRDHWLQLYKVRKGYGFFAQELPKLSKFLSFIGLNLTPTWVGAANKELEEWCKKLCDSTVAFLEETGPATQDSAEDPVVVRALLTGIEKEEKMNGTVSLIYSTAILQPKLSVASEIIDHVLAGQETTGVALTYLTWHLSQSEDLQHQLRDELLKLKPDTRLDAGKVSIPNSGQLDSLPLLHALVIETVRRYAPAGGPEPRVTPSPSCRIGHYEVPGGVRVSASAYNLHRDERYFPDPETWDHTRWLHDPDDDEKPKELSRQFWGFSSGGRMCLGSNFAMHEMKMVIAAIYSNYTSHIVDDDGIEPTDGYTAHPTSGQLWLRFQRIT